MSETEQPARPAEAVDPELVRRKQEVQLAEWEARQASERQLQEERRRAELEVWRSEQRALDVQQPTTMRERLAHAAALARSDVVPRGFRGGARPGDALTERQERIAAASIVLATEWGAHLGFPGLAALQHLQVVEGNLGVKPASARGMILAAGCDLDDEVMYSRAGFPIAHTVRITRPGGTPKSVMFRLEQALRAGLISEITRDEDGEVTGVVARSATGKALPWENYTEAMLQHRATARMISLYASDITGGMELAAEFSEAVAHPSPIDPSAAVVETLARVAPEPASAGVDYKPAADLAEIRERLGIPDGRAVPWWDHADAQTRLGIRRRSKVQLAADRIKAWVLTHMDEAEDLYPPPGHPAMSLPGRPTSTPVDEVVDADIVEAEEQGPAAGTDDGAVVADADMASAEQPAAGSLLLPSEWEREFGVRILDPDGWRADGKSWDDRISRSEFESRMERSTVSLLEARVAPFRDAQMTGPLPDAVDAPLPEPEFETVGTEHAGLPNRRGSFSLDMTEAEYAAEMAAEMAEASQDDEPTVEDMRKHLLGVLDALAENAGQGRNQFARRAIALRRRSPEDWTAEELVEYIRSVAPDADLRME